MDRAMQNKEQTNSFVVLMVIVCLSVASTGCVTRFYVSVPEEIPEGRVGGFYGKETIHLEFPGLELSAQLQTYQKKGSTFLIERLGVWLLFDTGDEMFAINPERVLLAKNGKELKPMTYLGPETKWISPRAAALGCGSHLRTYSLGWAALKMDITVDDVENGNDEKSIFKPSGKVVSFKGEKCFMLWYPTEASPEPGYVLSIQGVTRAGKPFSIPEIGFRKGSVSRIFPTP